MRKTFPLSRHRSHHFAYLHRLWKWVAATSGFEWHFVADVNGDEVFGLTRKARTSKAPRWYLSAGVHGDEVAAVWGLLRWVMLNPACLEDLDLTIFPILNPYGFRHNTRTDANYVDLNRRFHDQQDPVIGGWHQLMRDQSFDFALCLHEDYDANGCYFYEVADSLDFGVKVLALGDLAIGYDRRSKIDGHAAQGGRIVAPGKLPAGQWPEALILRDMGVPLSVTFETPSEAELELRIQSHVGFLENCYQLIKNRC